MKDWRLLLAIVGVIFLVARGTFSLFLPIESESFGDTRTHPPKKELRPGFKGEIVLSGIEETWTFEVPKKLKVRQSGRLFIKCEIKEYLCEIEIDTSCSNTKISKPLYIDSSITIAIQGPFEWESDQTKTTQKKHPNPIEWSWVFTPKERGEKLIQVELPAIDDTSNLKFRTILFPNQDRLLDSTSRFVVIPVKIEGLFPVSEEDEKCIMLLAWLIGPAFTAPWLKWLVKYIYEKIRKSKPESKIILPS